MKTNRLAMLSTACLVTLAMSACAQQQSPITAVSQATTADTNAWEGYTTAAKAALAKGDTAQAETLYKQALAEAEKTGQDSIAVAYSVSNLADFYYAQGDGDQANRLYNRALVIKQKLLGTEHKEVAKDLAGLGAIAAKQGKLSDAQQYYRQALAIREKSLDANDPLLAQTRQAYDDILKQSKLSASK